MKKGQLCGHLGVLILFCTPTVPASIPRHALSTVHAPPTFDKRPAALSLKEDLFPITPHICSVLSSL